jgi:hypothetical protein
MQAAHDSPMGRIALLLGATLTLVLTSSAAALLTPGRSLTAPTPVTTISVTGRTVVYVVSATPDNKRCAFVQLWDTARKGLWRFGEETTRICKEGVSTGSGIFDVSTTGRRAFWVTFAGGNFRDYDLWTATATRRAPRRLAQATADVDSDTRPLVLGEGTSEGVPYAVGKTVTFVADSGARLFRAELASPVRLLAAGPGPGASRVVAALENGSVVVLSRTGSVLRSQSYEPGEVDAIALSGTGPVVQTGRDVSVCCSPTGPIVQMLSQGATMLDYRQRTIVYRNGAQVRARRVSTGEDTLLQVIPVRPWQPMPFSTSSWGSAWAKGRVVSWRSGPLG